MVGRETKKKETEDGFWDCHLTVHKPSNEHDNFPREIIIYCLPTIYISPQPAIRNKNKLSETIILLKLLNPNQGWKSKKTTKNKSWVVLKYKNKSNSSEINDLWLL